MVGEVGDERALHIAGRKNSLLSHGEGGMEFRLTYEGQLLSTNSNSTRARKDYKHCVRQQFQRQMKRLYEINPLLSTGKPSGKGLGGYARRNFQSTTRTRLRRALIFMASGSCRS